MAETIESFVAKLQEEGVQAGQQAAEKLRAEAEKQAEEIVKTARREAEKIAADAKAQAENIMSRSKTELALAARDAVLRLRETLNRALQAVLTRAAESKLKDAKFLGELLHEMVMLYAKADIEGSSGIKINVCPEIRQKLINWALGELGREAIDSGHVSIDLKGTLAGAGFEYNVTGATVEVTLESVVETLKELVTPALGEVIDRAANEQKT